MAYVRFGSQERQNLLTLLQTFKGETARGVWSMSTFGDLMALLSQVIAYADLVCEDRSIAFTASRDHKRYFASPAGLWCLSDQGEDVTPREWWLAVLYTHAHFVNLRVGV